MFGGKLRSWMDIVRPRKKQQRKEKQKQSKIKPEKSFSSENEILEENDGGKKYANNIHNSIRYSGTNLSSPESAYSTGYSTDGTSPGAPPEYYINIRTGTRYFPSGAEKDAKRAQNNNISLVPNEAVKPTPVAQTPKRQKSPKNDYISTLAVKVKGECTTVSMTQDYDRCVNQQTKIALHNNFNSSTGVLPRGAEVIVNSGITSPRQRNRIRTNPWLPGSNMSPCKINATVHSPTPKPNISSNVSSPYFGNSTISRSPLGKTRPRRGSTSSTCSSASLNWSANNRQRRHSDTDEDRTLNEMMGKYDESYVYEKETDILSDSDPTDCDTDIDTGRDGGDEEEPLDFIDNSSFVEFNVKEDRNTGHCTYFNFETQRKVSSRRRKASRRCKQRSEEKTSGSRSAGATPVSARRTEKRPVSKLALDDQLKRRSNSVSLARHVDAFDRRDKEADKKYKELIVEADRILTCMKQTGSSPRRLPGPANKRVELLKTESTKGEMPKAKLVEDHLAKIPSSSFSRFSPKRNHITNFMKENSPLPPRREEVQHVAPRSPAMKKKQYRQGGSRSPKYRKKPAKKIAESDSSDEGDTIKRRSLVARSAVAEPNNFCCPQSEPVKRKIYHQTKTVAFNLNYESICNLESKSPNERRNSADNLRQQVLLNTIANLKKSLENQSASLKQVYNSSHDVKL